MMKQMKYFIFFVVALITILSLSSYAQISDVKQNFLYNDGTATRLQNPTGDYFVIGSTCTSDHVLASAADQLICGKLEIDGILYTDDSVNMTFPAAGFLTLDHTIDWIASGSTLVINTNAAADNVAGIENTIISQGDYSGVFAISHVVSSGGMTTPGDSVGGVAVTLNDHASDAANTQISGFVSLSGTSDASSNANWIFNSVLAETGLGGVTLTGSGSKYGNFVDIKDVGGTGDLIGAQYILKNATTPNGNIYGVNLIFDPQVAGVTAIDGIRITNIGSQSGTDILVAAGTFVDGIDLANATLTNAIRTGSGSWYAGFNAVQRFYLEAASTAHTDTNGVIEMDLQAGAASVNGINLNITADNDYNGIYGMQVTMTSYSAGHTLGNQWSAFRANLSGDNDDLDHESYGFSTSFNKNGGTSTMGGFHVGPDADIALRTESGVVQGAQGSDLASAADMAACTTNYCDITGTADINTIATTNFVAGTILYLRFDGNAATNGIRHNQAGTGASIYLSGSADFAYTTNDMLTLLYDGTVWIEQSRTII